MKDFIISGTRIRRELWWLAACLGVAYALNIFAIVHWDRPLSELYMTLGYVVTLAFMLYLILLVLRLLIWGCAVLAKRVIKKNNLKNQ